MPFNIYSNVYHHHHRRCLECNSFIFLLNEYDDQEVGSFDYSINRCRRNADFNFLFGQKIRCSSKWNISIDDIPKVNEKKNKVKQAIWNRHISMAFCLKEGIYATKCRFKSFFSLSLFQFAPEFVWPKKQTVTLRNFADHKRFSLYPHFAFWVCKKKNLFDRSASEWTSR